MGMKSSITTNVTSNVLVLVIWEDLGNAAKKSPLLVASTSPVLPDACMLCVSDISVDNIGTDEGVG